MDNIVNLTSTSRFYELIYIIRQEISAVDLERINNDISSLLTSYGAKIIKQEYWGLRNLAYEIKRNNKGHYMMLGVDIPSNECIAELTRKIKLSNEIIRNVLIKVKSISAAPSGILKSFIVAENANTVDVTITNQKNLGSSTQSTSMAIPNLEKAPQAI